MSAAVLGEEYVGQFLAHYASEYYDPQKAHEYYLQNRELKGQQSTADLTVKYATQSKRGNKTIMKVNKAASERKKEAWAYAKNQIGEAKKADLKGLSEQRKQVVEKARQSAQARREEISNKLTDLLKALTGQKSADSDKIDQDEKSALEKLDQQRAAESRKIRDDANRQIDAIPAVPDSVRGPQRERLVAARAKQIAKITGDTTRAISAVTQQYATKGDAVSADADQQRKDLAEKTTQERAQGHESATVTREQVSTQLKSAVDKARADYEAGKERLIAEYKAKSQKEFDAIKARV
jgi:hypothetical protein